MHACACILCMSLHLCECLCVLAGTSGNNRVVDAVTFPLLQAFECSLKQTLKSLTVNFRKAFGPVHLKHSVLLILTYLLAHTLKTYSVSTTTLVNYSRPSSIKRDCETKLHLRLKPEAAMNV